MGVWLSLLIERLTDYYPFGMEMGGRSYKSNDYRFGYTGHEKECDVAEGVYTTQYRLLDTRLGRWMSVDPLFAKYPDMSAYNYCGGNPVVFWDPDGSEFHNFFPNDYQNIKIDKKYIDLSKFAEDCRYDINSLINVVYCETDKNAFQQVALLNRYENDDALHIAGHGVCEGQFFRTDVGLIATSEVIRNLNTKDYDIIVLHSCDTGKESDQYKIEFVNGTLVKASISFANQISKEMPEKYIVAPSEVVKFGVDNTDDCEMFDPFEYIENGTWNIWQNGKVIGKISGDMTPTSDVIRKSIEEIEHDEQK